LRVVRFTNNKKESYGVLRNDHEILDVPSLFDLKGIAVPSCIEELVSLSSEGREQLEGLIMNLTGTEVREATIEKDDVSLRAPLLYPPKIICLGLNYRDHAEEAHAEIPDEAIVFMKPRTSIAGPEEPVVKPSFVNQLDYEVELAIVIGRQGKNIPLSEAKHYIFGYMAFNDISARGIQFKDGQWTKGKGFDTFAPTGPCITTSKQIGDPNNLNIQARVDGEVRQDSSTKNMIFNVYEVVHQLSRVMTLEPCDIIATGTPSGVAVFMKPEPKFLKPGNTVEIEIENIGVLRNPIIEEKARLKRLY
jgi:2-keto-4-pentenoate hydratase/2-oxohepta-3-ene-1,7-dioic acid hydratase in catechol pathway